MGSCFSQYDDEPSRIRKGNPNISRSKVWKKRIHATEKEWKSDYNEEVRKKRYHAIEKEWKSDYKEKVRKKRYHAIEKEWKSDYKEKVELLHDDVQKHVHTQGRDKKKISKLSDVKPHDNPVPKEVPAAPPPPVFPV